MIPKPASPAKSANKPRPITITPADLKNNGACLPCAKDADPNDNNKSIGKVPRTNANIMRNPDIKDPLERATTCIAWVNPQGKKNVPNPTMRGVRVLCSIFLKKLKIPEGSATLFFANTPTKLRPRSNITIDAKIPSIALNLKFIVINF